MGVIKAVYDRVLRDHLPRKVAVFNSVAVRQPRLFDRRDVLPDYEEALVEAIREEVREGETVVVVGGGWGVSTVVAARQVGPDGRVVTFEGAATQARRVEETAALNQIADRVEVRHAVVGEKRRLYDGADGAEVVAPDDLPPCDVLVLDCEGAEVGIVAGLGGRDGDDAPDEEDGDSDGGGSDSDGGGGDRNDGSVGDDGDHRSPRCVVVETHPMFDAPTAATRDLLGERGYEVVAERSEETPRGTVDILTALRR